MDTFRLLKDCWKTTLISTAETRCYLVKNSGLIFIIVTLINIDKSSRIQHWVHENRSVHYCAILMLGHLVTPESGQWRNSSQHSYDNFVHSGGIKEYTIEKKK